MVSVQNMHTTGAVLESSALESDVIAAVLNEPSTIEDLRETLTPSCFADPGLRRLWELLLNTHEKGQSFEINALAALIHSSELDIDDPHSYLLRLQSHAVPTRQILNLAQSIKDLYLRRRLAETGKQLELLATQELDRHTALDIIEQTEQELFTISEGAIRDSRLLQLPGLILHRDTMGDPIVTPSGFADLDKVIAGFRPQDLVVLAARPAVGKTAFALNILMNIVLANIGAAAETQKTCVFFSLEMSAEQLTERIIARNASISLNKLKSSPKSAPMSAEEQLSYDRFRQQARQCRLYIDDEPHLSPMRVRQVLRRIIRKGEHIGVVIIDYLQLMSTGSANASNRVQEISEISRKLKLVAKELNIPIIAISQLSRAVESRDPPLPQLSDLRDSGSIEQDADVVILLYRRDLYLKRRLHQETKETEKNYEERRERIEREIEKTNGVVTILIEKNRHGAQGQFTLKFDAPKVSFVAHEHNDTEFRKSLGIETVDISPIPDFPH